jgi:hypothetical protein
MYLSLLPMSVEATEVNYGLKNDLAPGIGYQKYVIYRVQMDGYHMTVQMNALPGPFCFLPISDE